MTDSALTRARRGFAWLSETFPGHVARVDVATLRVSRDDRCPIAQASGMRFTLVRSNMALTLEWLMHHGFMAIPARGHIVAPDYQALQEAWELLYMAFTVPGNVSETEPYEER